MRFAKPRVNSKKFCFVRICKTIFHNIHLLYITDMKMNDECGCKSKGNSTIYDMKLNTFFLTSARSYSVSVLVTLCIFYDSITFQQCTSLNDNTLQAKLPSISPLYVRILHFIPKNEYKTGGLCKTTGSIGSKYEGTCK